MITAIDSNVISAMLSGESSAVVVLSQLEEARRQGGLVIAAPVYAELLGYPNATQESLDLFLTKTGISVDFELEESIWRVAGNRYARYAQRRRKSSSNQPRRLLVDFLIGAHALHSSDRLLTLDRAPYRRDFPDLRIL